MLQYARLNETFWTQDGSVKSQIVYKSIFPKHLACVHRGTDCCVYFQDSFGGFYPISADDDICAGNFYAETVWS